VALYAELSAAAIRSAHLEPIEDVADRLRVELSRLGPGTPIAVLPEGPMTIPYLTTA
jgi:hypothetical protein